MRFDLLFDGFFFRQSPDKKSDLYIWLVRKNVQGAIKIKMEEAFSNIDFGLIKPLTKREMRS